MRAFATCVIALGLFAMPTIAGARAAGGAAGGPGDKNPTTASTNNGSDASATASSAPTADSKTDAPAKAEASSMESEIGELRELVESQAKQLQDQQRQMAALEEKLNGTSAAGTTFSATPANIAPAGAPTAAVVTTPTAASSASNAASPAQTETTGPASIAYKGITITPGGFMAAETAWRQKALGADINTPSFGSTVPFDGASAAHISEFIASGRQSRISMLAQGKIGSATIGGYYEMDFLSAGTTSNPNQSNSYTMRQRQFWGQAAFNNGITVTGGQQWSLITETTTGMNNRTENLPMTIDAQYHVGFSWARQEGFRVTKNFNNKLWLGLAVEESQATLTAHGNPTVSSGGTEVQTCTAVTGTTCTTGTVAIVNQTVTNNFLLGSFGTSGGLQNPLGNYAFNLAPDLVVKAVWEPGFGHYEVFGLLTSFHDRIFPCANLGGTVYPSGVTGVTNTTPPAGCSSVTSAQFATNDSRVGGGGGANARWALINKKVDFGLHFFGGSGIGRYGSSGLSDATVRPDGTLALLRNYQGLGTLQFHPTPKLDIYFNVGGEFTNRAGYSKSGGAPSTDNEGYGYITLNNSGCWTETQPVTGPSTSTNLGVPTGVGGATGFIPGPLANCTGDIRRVVEGTVGFWYRFYNGPKGRVQAGMQYSNYERQAFSGVTGTTSYQPHADENMIFTSFRYYLP